MGQNCTAHEGKLSRQIEKCKDEKQAAHLRPNEKKISYGHWDSGKSVVKGN